MGPVVQVARQWELSGRIVIAVRAAVVERRGMVPAAHSCVAVGLSPLVAVTVFGQRGQTARLCQARGAALRRRPRPALPRCTTPVRRSARRPCRLDSGWPPSPASAHGNIRVPTPSTQPSYDQLQTALPGASHGPGSRRGPRQCSRGRMAVAQGWRDSICCEPAWRTQNGGVGERLPQGA